MYDLRWVPMVVTAGNELAWSAMPDAPVIPETPRRERQRLRGLVERLAASRPRLHATRVEKEELCGT